MPLFSPSPAPGSLMLPDAGQLWKSRWVKARFGTRRPRQGPGGDDYRKSRRGKAWFGTLALGTFAAVAILTFSGCQSVSDTTSISWEPGFTAPATATAPSPPSPTPAREPAPTRITPTAMPPSSTPSLPESGIPPAETEAEASLPQLTIAPIPGDLPDYNRKDWKHWIDPDRDCQNTRAEVLIAESAAPVTFTRDRECTVATGRWLDPFTGTTFTEAGDLDVDHLVPLANAHRSGGWKWSADQKERFANSTDYENHLIAVDKSANRAKGARGPEGWQPPNHSYHCQYALDWIAIKDKWELTATAGEWDALAEMLERC